MAAQSGKPMAQICFFEEFRLLPGYTGAVDLNKSVYMLDYMIGEFLHC